MATMRIVIYMIICAFAAPQVSLYAQSPEEQARQEDERRAYYDNLPTAEEYEELARAEDRERVYYEQPTAEEYQAEQEARNAERRKDVIRRRHERSMQQKNSPYAQKKHKDALQSLKRAESMLYAIDDVPSPLYKEYKKVTQRVKDAFRLANDNREAWVYDIINARDKVFIFLGKVNEYRKAHPPITVQSREEYEDSDKFSSAVVEQASHYARTFKALKNRFYKRDRKDVAALQQLSQDINSIKSQLVSDAALKRAVTVRTVPFIWRVIRGYDVMSYLNYYADEITKDLKKLADTVAQP